MLKRYVRASFKKRRAQLFIQKDFCVRVPVDESEICIRIGTVNFAVLGVKMTSTGILIVGTAKALMPEHI